MARVKGQSVASSKVEHKSSSSSSGSLICMVTLLIVLLMTPTFVSARYLPTRSDNSRRERIKEVLRALYELSAANDNDLRSLDIGNYGAANSYASRDGSNGPLAFEFTGDKVSPLSSSGLSKRSIAPFIARNMS